MASPINLLYVIAFLDLLAVALVVPLISNHARQLGASHIAVGLLGSVYAAFQLGSGPLVGSLSDLKGRKAVLIGCLILCSLAYMLTGIVSTVISILCLRAVLGLFKQTQMLTKAMVPDYEANQEKQSEVYGKLAALAAAGITVGPVIGGHIVEYYPEDGFRYMSIAVSTCFLINAGLVYYFIPIDQNVQKIKKISVTKDNKSVKEIENPLSIVSLVIQSFQQSVAQLWLVDWAKYWDVFILKGLIGFAMGVYYSNNSTYLKTVYELTPKHVGYILSLQGIVGTISSYYMGFINSLYSDDKDFSYRNLHVFVIVTVSLLGLILSFNVYMYAFWLMPLAVGNAIGRLVTLEMILRRSHGAHRGKLIGASASMRSLAGVGAPMVTGFISEYVGVSYVTYASVFTTSLGLALSYHLYLKQKKIKTD